LSAAALAKLYADIAGLVARHARDESPESMIGGLFLTRRCAPSQPLYTDQRPSFWLVAQGRKRLTVGGQTLDYGVGDCLLVALDLPVTSRVIEASDTNPHLCVGMEINAQRLVDLIGRLPDGAASAKSEISGAAVTAASPDLLDATLRMLRLLERPNDIAAMAPLIEQEILYRLLTGPHGARLINIAMAEGAGQKITRAVAWLRNHFAQPLRIGLLAESVGMSESSLHHHFKAVTNMTPMQYQKQLRLHEARRLMLADGADVGAAGFAVGYQSPSQFSREYRRFYGVPPSRDLESLLAPVAA
jgi:AraC-like DNA-binding protein